MDKDAYIIIHLMGRNRAYLQTMCREAGITGFSSMSMKEMREALAQKEMES